MKTRSMWLRKLWLREFKVRPQYLVRWKGYDASEDKCLGGYDLVYAIEALEEF